MGCEQSRSYVADDEQEYYREQARLRELERRQRQNYQHQQYRNYPTRTHYYHNNNYNNNVAQQIIRNVEWDIIDAEQYELDRERIELNRERQYEIRRYEQQHELNRERRELQREMDWERRRELYNQEWIMDNNARMIYDQQQCYSRELRDVRPMTIADDIMFQEDIIMDVTDRLEW